MSYRKEERQGEVVSRAKLSRVWPRETEGSRKEGDVNSPESLERC